MEIKVLLQGEDSKVPQRGSQGAAGYDLYANEDKIIQPSNRGLISTGIVIQLPSGTYGRIAPRSGLSVRGIDVGAGVIDEDYLGEIKVLLINNSINEFRVNKGDRIAQLLVEKVFYPEFKVIKDKKEFSETNRGEGGFGSTGI